MPSDRMWGYWTEHKLQMLAEYLPAFTSASKRAGSTLYLDLFAGDTRNISRTTGAVIDGSPRVALNTVPAFDHVVLFELPARAARLQAELAAEFPGRKITVVAGDCNTTLPGALNNLRDVAWAPSFALVDQYAAEVHWSSLAALSDFRRSTRGLKTELWLLFAPAMITRGLASETDEAVADFTARVDAMFGSADWRDIHEARLADELPPEQYRDELVNLMRWRLENVLGYRTTHAFDMRNVSGVPLYSMIFATSHPTGDKVMDWVYEKAARIRPQMQAEAASKRKAKRIAEREATSGMASLFDDIEPVVKRKEAGLYLHMPPATPWRRGSPASG